MAKLGLVTVLYNSNDVLEEFFSSLAAQSYKDWHLYIIDNSVSAATDELIDRLSKKYLDASFFTHVKNATNNGVAKGNNQGIELSLAGGASHVLLLNNDIAFTQPHLLQQLVKQATGHSEHLIVPKIFYYGTRTIWMAGGAFLNNRGYTTHEGENQPDGETYSKRAYFDYAPTCFMLISKEVFDRVGRMDEKYFVYYDDTDFVIRCLKKGYRVLLMPELEVFHKVAFSTGGGESPFTTYYSNRNRVYFIKKNLKFPQKWVALLYTILSRGGRYFTTSGEQRKMLVKGLKEGFKM